MSPRQRSRTGLGAVPQVLILVGLLACTRGESQRNTSTAPDEAAIRQMASDYTGAIEAGDRDKFLTFYAEDIVIMPPGQPVMRGRQAAAGFAGPLFDQFKMQEKITYDDLRVDGDWAAGRFSYTFSVTPKSGGTTSTEVGKAMVWLKRTGDGSWKFSHWIWNQDQAPK